MELVIFKWWLTGGGNCLRCGDILGGFLDFL
jgi:hypothetical protein